MSSTLTSADEWRTRRCSGAYDPDAVRELKDRVERTYISGSGTLVRALLADGLVDELHLFVYPLVLGSGKKLFPDGTQRIPLAVADHEAFDNGVLHLTYAPVANG